MGKRMMEGKWRVIAPCVNQDTGRRHDIGQYISELSIGEYGRLSAFHLIEDIKENDRKETKENNTMTEKKSINKAMQNRKSIEDDKRTAQGPTEKAIQKGPYEQRGQSGKKP